MRERDPATSPDSDQLALMLQVVELREQLAAAQDMLVEMAIDAGDLHACIASLQDELARVRADRDTWQRAAERQRVVAAR